jgi:hypothetical protein
MKTLPTSNRCLFRWVRRCAVSMLVVAPVAASAQAISTASIRGQVSDQSQAGIAGVSVTLLNTATGSERSAITALFS